MTRRPKGKLESTGDILDGLIRKTELGAVFKQARIWEEWDELAGPKLAPHVRPVSIKDKVLRVEADSAVWMHRLVYRKWTLIRRVNRMARQELINDVFVALGDGADDGE